MTENESKPELFDLIKRLPGWITSLIAFIAAIIGFIKLWQGNAGLMTTILLILGIGGLLIICAYIVFKKIPSQFDATTKRFAFPKLRPFAITGLILIPLIFIVGFTYQIYLKNKPPDKIIVLVADFVGPEPQKWAVTEKILERLENALTNEPKAQLKALGKAITQQEGSAKAKEIGAKKKASIVIWGWYAVTEQACNISVHFNILKKQAWFPEIKTKPYLAQISELQNFVLQTRLSKEMSCLTSFIVGLISYQISAYHDAIRNFTKALDEKTETFNSIDEVMIYLFRGISYYFLNEFSQAISDYTTIIALIPKIASAFQNRGIAYDDFEDYGRALATDAFFFRGIAYANLKDFDRAIVDYNQAIALDPEDADAFFNRGISYANLKNFDRAIADYSQAIELDPKDTAAFFNRGNAYADIKDFDHAIADYNQTIALDPKDTATFFNRGIAYAYIKDFDRAIADYNQAIALDPKDAAAFNNRGNAYLNLNNYDRAIADFTKAIELDPKLAQAFNNRGFAYYKLYKYDGAIADYSQAIRLNPKYLSAYLNFSENLIIAGKSAEAEQTTISAIKLAESTKDQAISKYLLAVTLKIQGKSTAEIDAELEQLCAQEFEIGWSFDTFEKWLAGAELSTEVKTYIREKIELLKQHRK